MVSSLTLPSSSEISRSLVAYSWSSATPWSAGKSHLLVFPQSAKRIGRNSKLVGLKWRMRYWWICEQLPPCWTRPAYLPLPGFHHSGKMEYWAFLRFNRRSSGMHNGGSRLQGEVVCCFPRLCPQYFQRVCQQLLGGAFGAPATRLPQIRLFPNFMCVSDFQTVVT